MIMIQGIVFVNIYNNNQHFIKYNFFRVFIYIFLISDLFKCFIFNNIKQNIFLFEKNEF